MPLPSRVALRSRAAARRRRRTTGRRAAPAAGRRGRCTPTCCRCRRAPGSRSRTRCARRARSTPWRPARRRVPRRAGALSTAHAAWSADAARPLHQAVRASASRCCTAWNEPTGTPYCRRSAAYATVTSSTPAHHADEVGAGEREPERASRPRGRRSGERARCSPTGTTSAPGVRACAPRASDRRPALASPAPSPPRTVASRKPVAVGFAARARHRRPRRPQSTAYTGVARDRARHDRGRRRARPERDRLDAAPGAAPARRARSAASTGPVNATSAAAPASASATMAASTPLASGRAVAGRRRAARASRRRAPRRRAACVRVVSSRSATVDGTELRGQLPGGAPQLRLLDAVPHVHGTES